MKSEGRERNDGNGGARARETGKERERERMERVRLHGASNGEKFDRLPFHRSAIPSCRIVSAT